MVFEKIVFKHLYNHLVENNLITENQSGFRPGDSVTNQLLSLVNDIHTAFVDKYNLEVRSIYLDMSKAFDTSHNRKQRVLINGSESDWGNIKLRCSPGFCTWTITFLGVYK